jgi:acetyl esterase/lipase
MDAVKWHIDPHKIGVLGFSAGGYLVAEVSTHFMRRLYTPVDAADKGSARPDFAIAIYPGHLAIKRDLARDNDALNPNVSVSRETPPTFLVQAEDDYVDGVKQSLVYYMALAKAHVPAELHIYATGGHAVVRRTAARACARKAALTLTDAMYTLVDTSTRERRWQEPQSSPCSSGEIASPYAYRPRWRVLRISPSGSPWRSRSRMMGCSLGELVGQG